VSATETVHTAEATNARQLRCRVRTVGVRRVTKAQRGKGDRRPGTVLLVARHLEVWCCRRYSCRCGCRSVAVIGHRGVFVGLASKESNAHLVVLLATTGRECHGLLECHGHCEMWSSKIVSVCRRCRCVRSKVGCSRQGAVIERSEGSRFFGLMRRNVL